jgi:2-oxoisovalerate dehydrogenase E2 component (dihydrolipoyl transacylase)
VTLHTIRMPDLGEGIAEVELVEWRVKPGDLVAEDQILCDVMTDKASVEIPSSVAGRVVERGGEIGQMMAVGSVLIRIEGEAAAAAPAPPAAATQPKPAPAPAQAPAAAAAAAAPMPQPRSAPSARALASPAVRMRARSLGVDLDRLQGSGPDGRILHADLDAAQPGRRRSGDATDGTRDVKLIGLRRVIAQKMQTSKRHIPHFTYVEEVDVTEMVALRDELNRRYGAARGELSPLAFVVRAVVRAVAGFPQVNARFDDEAGVLTLHEAVHLGVATQTDAGLMVPVLHQAQTLDLWACAAAISRLAASARAGKAERVQVEIGIRDDRSERIEIVSGLEEGDVLLTGAAHTVTPGTPVKLTGGNAAGKR